MFLLVWSSRGEGIRPLGSGDFALVDGKDLQNWFFFRWILIRARRSKQSFLISLFSSKLFSPKNKISRYEINIFGVQIISFLFFSRNFRIDYFTIQLSSISSDMAVYSLHSSLGNHLSYRDGLCKRENVEKVVARFKRGNFNLKEKSRQMISMRSWIW